MLRRLGILCLSSTQESDVVIQQNLVLSCDDSLTREWSGNSLGHPQVWMQEQKECSFMQITHT